MLSERIVNPTIRDVYPGARDCVINEINRRFPNGTGMEVGSWKGAFTKRILDKTSTKMLYAVDPWAYTKSETWWGGQVAKNQADMEKVYRAFLNRTKPYRDKHRLIIRRGTLNDVVIPEPLNWAYIDGSHEYKDVLSDLIQSSELILPGGVIFGDDWQMIPVQQAVTDFFLGLGAHYRWLWGRFHYQWAIRRVS